MIAISSLSTSRRPRKANMVVCRYYQQGRCRYGNNCKYEHIDPPGGGGGNTNDPFSTPTRGQGQHRRGGGKPTEEQPQWPLSAIGMKDNAEQGNELTGDFSPEELRVLAYSMAPRGMSAEVTQRESQLVAEHRAKVDALSRGGIQTHSPAGGSNGLEAKDPFAQRPGVAQSNNTGFGGAPQQNSGFGGVPQTNSGFGGFGMGSGNSGGAQQHNAFVQAPQQLQHPTLNAPPPQGNPGYGQPPAQIQSAAPAPNAAQDPQFSAAQFGFAKVPEAAPPPKYY